MSEDGGTAQEASGEASSAPAEIASRPDFVPEKFWNAKSGEVRMEDAFKSYSEIEKKGRERSDTMRKSIIDEMSSDKVLMFHMMVMKLEYQKVCKNILAKILNFNLMKMILF